MTDGDDVPVTTILVEEPEVVVISIQPGELAFEGTSCNVLVALELIDNPFGKCVRAAVPRLALFTG